MLAHSVGCRKKSLEHNDCLYVTSLSEWSVKKPLTNNVPSRKMTFKKIVEMLFQRSQKAPGQHWNNLFDSDFVNLGYVSTYFLRD